MIGLNWLHFIRERTTKIAKRGEIGIFAFKLYSMSSKKATSEINKKLGFNLIGKLFIKKLNRFIERGAEEWNVPPESIVMQLKLLNDSPKVLIKETEHNEHSLNITERAGVMEPIAKLAFKQLLVSNEYMAKEWNVPVHTIRMDLKMVNKKPELRILEEDGDRYLDMIL